MSKNYILLLLIVFVCITQNGYAESIACRDLFESADASVVAIFSDSDVKKLSTELNSVNPEQHTLSDTLRSNPPFSWIIFKKLATKFIPTDILNILGIVVGDPHNGNFNASVVNDHVEQKFVDTDDPGIGPYILDVVRFMAATKSVIVGKFNAVRRKEIFRYYLKGLNNEELSNNEIPDVIKEKLLKLTPDEYRKLEEQKAKDLTIKLPHGDFRLKTDEKEFFNIDNQIVKNKIKNFVEAKLGEGYQVYDVVKRVKDYGGSQKALRFTLLVKNPDSRITLFELKQVLPAATHEYLKQNTSLQEILDFFVYEKDNSELRKKFQVLDVNYNNKKIKFLLRPKLIYIYDFTNEADSKKANDEFSGLTFYNAYILGKIHGSQSNSQIYRETLKKYLANDNLINRLVDLSDAILQIFDKVRNAY